ADEVAMIRDVRGADGFGRGAPGMLVDVADGHELRERQDRVLLRVETSEIARPDDGDANAAHRRAIPRSDVSRNVTSRSICGLGVHSSRIRATTSRTVSAPSSRKRIARSMLRRSSRSKPARLRPTRFVARSVAQSPSAIANGGMSLFAYEPPARNAYAPIRTNCDAPECPDRIALSPISTCPAS